MKNYQHPAQGFLRRSAAVSAGLTAARPNAATRW
jgi:hypothetical protein